MLVLALTKDNVTGATRTCIMPTPTTSPVFIGESPRIKLPCEEESANTAPFVD
jgi:hypothetical protein